MCSPLLIYEEKEEEIMKKNEKNSEDPGRR
jgi:hypothetical protein